MDVTADRRGPRGPLSRLFAPRGAALVAVLLLTMVLSAIGVIAVQNTFNSLRLSGNYRLRRQAQETADAALSFESVFAGEYPSDRLGRLETDLNLKMGAAPVPDRVKLIERGGSLVMKQSDYASLGLLSTGGEESGLFNNASNASHDSDDGNGKVSFDVVIRDPAEGPPVEGSDGAFCKRRVYIGSRATYDDLERTGTTQNTDNWKRPARAATGLLGMEAWIGPVPCNGAGTR